MILVAQLVWDVIRMTRIEKDRLQGRLIAIVSPSKFALPSNEQRDVCCNEWQAMAGLQISSGVDQRHPRDLEVS